MTNVDESLEPFGRMLIKHDLALLREETTALQINTGFLCNLTCKHCHQEAGPHRKEIMTRETMRQIIAYAGKNRFASIDITGGAPELNPHIRDMIAGLAPLTPRMMLRTNLTALQKERWDGFINFCKEYRVVIIASFPSLNPAQTDSQRGEGIFQQLIMSLKKLNSAGYGIEGSGLELDLAANPTGAFLLDSQLQVENRFHEILSGKWGITFNKLFTFNNAPLGRFRRWLQSTDNMETYLKKLEQQFNPCTAAFLMCRSMLSIDWQGYLYDCDFNLAAGFYMSGSKIHVTETNNLPANGSSIVVGDHCYACTAGAGFSCGGALAD
ncbi:MAG: arsenosugar biosynthesis radical SAM (seleno)protein ArsS [Smithella sp.]|jgi:radical SAM/Cys-rich protein